MRGLLELGLGATRVHGDTRGLWTFGLGLRLSPSLSVGGAGHLLTSSVHLGEVEFRDVDLDLGYGGLFARVSRPAPFRRSTWETGLLVGAGNADVRERTTDLRLDSDNFFVVQPSLGVAYLLAPPLRATASLSYRTVFGVEDLRGVEGADLRALVLAVGLRMSPL